MTFNLGEISVQSGKIYRHFRGAPIMVPAISSETSVILCQTTRCSFSENIHLHSRHRWNLKSHTVFYVVIAVLNGTPRICTNTSQLTRVSPLGLQASVWGIYCTAPRTGRSGSPRYVSQDNNYPLLDEMFLNIQLIKKFPRY